MIQALRRFFAIDRHGTTMKREAMVALTTFVIMAYIIGLPFGPAMVAIILKGVFRTLPALRAISAPTATSSCPAAAA
jgi:hypothetical protein